MVYSSCVDDCRDIRTCLDKDSNIEQICVYSPKYTSMCICADGYYYQNGECVLESECGCQMPNGVQVEQGTYILLHLHQ